MPSVHEASNGAAPGSSTNPVIERDQSQWLFTTSELLRTPSVLDGMPAAQELANRQKGVNFITQVGIMLKLPQLTLATASVYLHRLFMRQKMQTEKSPGLHHYSAAATALFLATKVEENCRKMRELVVACCRVAQKQPNLVVDEQNKEYWKWRDTILHNEDVLLEALCFDLQLDQPYRILFEFLQYYAIQDNKNLRNTSWAFLNDSHVTTMCLLHSPRTIAGAALYTGVRLANITLPDDDRGRPWWEHLELDVFEIQRACNQMFEIYETADSTVPRVGTKNTYTREDDMTFLDNTRSPAPGMSPARSMRSVSQLSGTKRDRDDVEGSQSEEWGAPSRSQLVDQAAPSPKRARRDTPEVEQPAPSRVPPTASSRIPPGASANGGGSRVPARVPPATNPPSAPPSNGPVDDVQQRIDDIVKASSRHNSNTSVPTLTRRPSGQQAWQGDARAPEPARPRIDSGANGGGHGNEDRELRPGAHQEGGFERRPPSVDDGAKDRGYDRQRLNVTEPRPPPPPPPADEIDYGSEEGEV